MNKKNAVKDNKSEGSLKALENLANVRCPIHHAGHSLLECNSFRQKSMEVRGVFLQDMLQMPVEN